MRSLTMVLLLQFLRHRISFINMDDSAPTIPLR